MLNYLEMKSLKLIVAFSKFIGDFNAKGVEGWIVTFKFSSEVATEFSVGAGQEGRVAGGSSSEDKDKEAGETIRIISIWFFLFVVRYVFLALF